MAASVALVVVVAADKDYKVVVDMGIDLDLIDLLAVVA
jgi:hypothetical protein